MGNFLRGIFRAPPLQDPLYVCLAHPPPMIPLQNLQYPLQF